MSADRETNHGMTSHDMTHTDIAVLLADAADEVEIGIAPYDAVLRGGRRRKARRWAVATATAVVLVGSAGTLAVAGMPGGHGDRGSSVATSAPTAPAPDVRTPSRTLLAAGTDQGKDWRVSIDVWEAPRNEREARAERGAMAEFGHIPSDLRDSSDLIGKSSYFVRRSFGDTGNEQVLIEDAFTAEDTMSGKDIEAAAVPLEPGADGPERLVVGQVAVTARSVTCTWKDGSTTEVPVVSEAHDVNSDDFVIRPADGSPVNWFVCLAPQGTAFQSVAVTK
ncbi:hypothetical protein EAO75_19260 [Streptomyces sp. uw30]|uniref:hypothetical protein n=1 Tax=Streptomyces sp. uw30 TaxID=1828179 RepID=UPI0011CD9441|nr:hypothetical protein [Streptomyces sp. uw30]TXS45052.1 hypothetical protein EAO75_19260 [Streptomyces sp. uw30]